MRLRDCRRDFREETLQRKAEMEEALASLQEQVERGKDSGGPLDWTAQARTFKLVSPVAIAIRQIQTLLRARVPAVSREI
jgi:hypothetical protein